MTLRRPPLWLILPALFVLLVLLFHPFRYVFEIDGDEGLNLMRAFLSGHGAALYADIITDQPPAFPLLLTVIFSIFGFEVTVGRLTVLALSALLVLAATAYLEVFWGKATAAAGLILLLILPQYLRLSTAVMIGLPSLAFGLISFLFLLLWHRERRSYLLVLSAALLAVSIMVKAFTLILIPAFGLGLALQAWADIRGDASPGAALRAPALWAATISVVLSAFLFGVVGAGNLTQLVSVHLEARQAAELQQQARSLNINAYLTPLWALLLLAALGARRAWRQRAWTTGYLAAWAGLGYAGLSMVVPVWDHQQLLVTVPLALMAAIGVGSIAHHVTGLAARDQRPSLREWLLPAAGVGLLLVSLRTGTDVLARELALGLPNFGGAGDRAQTADYRVLGLMWAYAEGTDLVLTDRPIYAFRLKKPVPPQTAVFSTKRMATGSLTEEDLLAIMESSEPGQVLIARFHLPSLRSYVEESPQYGIVYDDSIRRLFVRNDIGK